VPRKRKKIEVGQQEYGMAPSQIREESTLFLSVEKKERSGFLPCKVFGGKRNRKQKHIPGGSPFNNRKN